MEQISNIDKERQKQLITEIMDLDAKNGLYEDMKPKIDIQPMTQEEMDEIRNPAYKYFDIDDTVNELEKLAANLANPNADKTDNWKEGYLYAEEQLELLLTNVLDHLCDKMESISQEQINNDNFQLARYRTFKYIFEYIQSLNVQPIKAKETLYTEEEVIKFAEWCRDKAVSETVYGNVEKTNNWELKGQQKVLTTKELLQEFLKSLKQPKQ